MSATAQELNTCETYNEKHCIEVMKLLNADRKVKKTFCDGALQAEGKEYPVHKGIVGLVSEFLSKIFTSEMREKYEKVVKINNMTDDVLGHILEFIYTGFLSITLDNVFDLLEGAEYMQVVGLKNNCQDFLVQSTGVENCLKLRAYGQRYNLEELCDASNQVIAENFADVIQHEDFNELNSNDVSKLISTRKEASCEEVVFTSIVRWVNHNMDQRQELFVNLFSLVDLSVLSKTFLNDTILSEPLVFNSLHCVQRLLNPSGPLVLATKSSSPELNADKFVIIGGTGTEKNCVTYNSKGKYPLQLPELSVERCGANVLKIKNRLYIAGGADKFDGSSCHQSAEMLNLEDPKKWVKIADMSEGRIYAASAVSNDRMLVTGGCNEATIVFRSCEIYNCEMNRWLAMEDMLEARVSHGMVSLNDTFYCVGGATEHSCLSSAECYDEKAREWQEIAPMPTAREGLAVVALNGFIYAIGGVDESYLATVERYSPETNTWTKCADLNVARAYHGACVMNGNIYVVGGEDVKSVEVYDEAEDKWEICFDIDAPTFAPAVVAL